MLRLVLGRAGAGKTRFCLEEVAAELRRSPQGPALILLVPEQATFQLEQALLSMPGVVATARAHVVGFRRLAWRVLEEAGGAARPAVGELGRRMVLRAVLQRRARDLRVFARAAERPGFVERLAATLRELRAYGVDAAVLRAQWRRWEEEGRGQEALAAKLHDLALLLEELDRQLAGRFVDPEQRLALAARLLPQAPSFRGARVWVDGFADFTGQELALLAALMRVADQTTVCLCLDPDGADEPGDEDDVFRPTRETRRRLLRLAQAAGVPVLPPVRLAGEGAVPARFRAAPALARIERAFAAGRGPAPGDGVPGAPREVRLVVVRDPRQEVEAAAREVLRLVREEGLRFREIAVVLRDLEEYDDLIRAAFGAHGIPVFVDRRRPVLHHPLVELLRSALELVIHDWPYDAVFRLLKTDLGPLDRDEADRLENYVLACGIRGDRWYDGRPWTYRPWRDPLEGDGEEGEPGPDRQLAEMNELRRRVVEALYPFHQAVAGARERPWPAARLTQALYGLLERLGVPERLQAWSRAAEAEGDLEAALEHLQVWEGVVELLDQAVESLGEEGLTLEEYLQVLEAGWQALRVGLIPPGLDQVLVGGVERSRHPNVRAALLLGVTEGNYPRVPEEDPVLADAERDRLAAAGVELGPTARQRLLHERYLAYIALTRASEYLYVSYPLADEEGRPRYPSPVVRRLQELFPGLRPEPAGEPLEDPAAASDARQLAAALARRLARSRAGEPLPGPWAALWARGQGLPGLAEVLAPLRAALAYGLPAPPLPADLARALYGEPLRAGVSRLERFAACPFQHFCAHGLRLRERARDRLEAPELGLLMHAAVHRLVERLQALDPEAGPEALASLVSEVLAQLAPRLRDGILHRSGRHRHLLRRLERTLRAVARVLREHDRRGRFRPVALEAAFGEPGGLAPLRVGLPGGGVLALRGRVDRIDVAVTAGGRRLVRVIDYKRAPRELRLDEVYHGLALQLPVYLQVALEAGPALAGGAVEPAGMLYFPLHDALERADGPPGEEADEPPLRPWRAGGWVAADPEVVAAMDREGTGELVPVTLRADGTPGARSRVLPPERLAALCRHAVHRAADLGARMLAGEVRALPYRLRGRTPCETCSFAAVCQFDRGLPGSRYRQLAALEDREVLARLPAADGPAGSLAAGGGAGEEADRGDR